MQQNRRPAALRTRDLDGAPMGTDDVFDDGETEAGSSTGSLRGKEWLKYPLESLSRNPPARVLHQNGHTGIGTDPAPDRRPGFGCPRARFGADGCDELHPTAGRSRIEGVRHEIHEGLLEQIRVRPDRQEACGDPHLQLDSTPLRQRLQQLDEPVQERAHGIRADRGSPRSSVLQELAETPRDSLGLPKNGGDVSFRRMVGGKPLPDALRASRDDIEGGPDLVRHLARQSADRRQLLPLLKLPLQLQPGLPLLDEFSLGPLKLLHHTIERRCQLSDLIPPSVRDALTQLPATKGQRRLNQPVQWPADAHASRHPDDQNNGKAEKADPQDVLAGGLGDFSPDPRGRLDDLQDADSLSPTTAQGQDDIHNGPCRTVEIPHEVSTAIQDGGDLLPRHAGGGRRLGARTGGFFQPAVIDPNPVDGILLLHHLGEQLLDVLRPTVSQGVLHHQLDRVGENQDFLLHLTDQPLAFLLIAKVGKSGHHQGDGKKQQEG